MKATLFVVLLSFASAASAADCVTNSRGKAVCSNGENAAVVNRNTGTVTTTEGKKTAVNTRTGNAAVAETNQNGVTTTKTAQGGQAKTKNGMGVAEGPDGTVCAKGKNNQGCKKK